jgi:hypothetical protein
MFEGVKITTLERITHWKEKKLFEEWVILSNVVISTPSNALIYLISRSLGLCFEKLQIRIFQSKFGNIKCRKSIYKIVRATTILCTFWGVQIWQFKCKNPIWHMRSCIYPILQEDHFKLQNGLHRCYFQNVKLQIVFLKRKCFSVILFWF